MGLSAGINTIFHVAAVGVIVAAGHSMLKQFGKEDFGWLLTVAGIVYVLIALVGAISDLFNLLHSLFQL